jgi:hypothetical protein
VAFGQPLRVRRVSTLRGIDELGSLLQVYGAIMLVFDILVLFLCCRRGARKVSVPPRSHPEHSESLLSETGPFGRPGCLLPKLLCYALA